MAKLKSVEKKIKKLLKQKKSLQTKISEDKKKIETEENENEKKIKELKEKLGIKDEEKKASPKKTVLKSKIYKLFA